MALKFGLNVKQDSQGGRGAQQRPFKSLLDDDDEYDNINPTDTGGDEQDQRPIEDLTISVNVKPSLSGQAKSTIDTTSRRSQARQPAIIPARNSKSDNIQQFSDLSSNRISQKHAEAAKRLDASIYDYDAYHDAQSTVAAARKAAATKDSQDRQPKYMDKLLDAAARRKQDQVVAREKFLQRERETEGDEFADKEKFVTSAYKAQQEDARKAEEEEARKTAEEQARRRKLGGGLQGFYRSIINDGEKRHSEAVESARMLENGTLPQLSDADGIEVRKTDLELANELRRKGVDVHVNDEGQVTDKRQLLNAGLNVGSAAAKKASEDQRRKKEFDKQKMHNSIRSGTDFSARERQTRMLETQIAETQKRAADELVREQDRLAQAARTTKTDADISSARARYLARKAEAAAVKDG